MLKNIKNKLNYNTDILLNQKFNVPFIFKEMINNYKKIYPNRKVKYALLNSDLREMIDFIVILECENEAKIDGEYVKIYLILIATRLSHISLHSYNYLRDFGTDFLLDYYHDLNLEAIQILPSQFELFLNELNITKESKLKTELKYDEESKSMKEKPIILNGLTMDKKCENYFANPENINHLFKKINELKFQYDQTQYKKI